MRLANMKPTTAVDIPIAHNMQWMSSCHLRDTTLAGKMRSNSARMVRELLVLRERSIMLHNSWYAMTLYCVIYSDEHYAQTAECQ